MIFIIEPKDGYLLEVIGDKLSSMNISFIIVDLVVNSAIKADLTFDEVCSLKDMAYCTHMEHDDT